MQAPTTLLTTDAMLNRVQGLIVPVIRQIVTALTVPGGVEQQAWQPLPLSGGWASYGGVTSPPGYFMDSLGRVLLRGAVVKSGGTSTICVLPEMYRPKYIVSLPTVGDGLFACVHVDSAGLVTLALGAAATYIHLDSVQFDTRV
jgi:hypothetical protein